MFKALIAGLFALITLIPLGASAQGPQPGIDYAELKQPQPVDSGNKIEVLEFFWYNCPHCYALEPTLEPWLKKLPKEAQFRRVPAIFNDQWALAGRAYYALEATGDVERVHRALFDAIHKDGLKITDEKAVGEWLGKKGGDPAKFSAAYRSFAVESKLKRALQLTQAYQLDGVPTLAVQGKYIVSAGKHGSAGAMLTTTEFLITKAIAEAAKSPAKK
jgi:thiol:disulfide interchange protein DsbA